MSRAIIPTRLIVTDGSTLEAIIDRSAHVRIGDRPYKWVVSPSDRRSDANQHTWTIGDLGGRRTEAVAASTTGLGGGGDGTETDRHDWVGREGAVALFECAAHEGGDEPTAR